MIPGLSLAQATIVPPGINHKAVAVCDKAGFLADLVRRNDIAAIFNSTGLEDRFPVVLTGRHGEAGRSKDDLGSFKGPSGGTFRENGYHNK